MNPNVKIWRNSFFLLLVAVLGYALWSSSSAGRYQQGRHGGILDTKTGEFLNPLTMRSFRQEFREAGEKRARLAIWNLIKGEELSELSPERIRASLVKQGHTIPPDFDSVYNQASKWWLKRVKSGEPTKKQLKDIMIRKGYTIPSNFDSMYIEALAIREAERAPKRSAGK